MKHWGAICDDFRGRRGSIRASSLLRPFLVLLFALLACGAITRAEKYSAQGAPSRIAATPAVRASLDDFDGDFHPDQIAVQTGNNEFSGTQYTIEVRLSAAGRQTIPVFSLPGGIEVLARDVNGDRSLDLVLTTTSLRRPVAILLNDGHGKFTRAEPDEFPRAFQDADTSWESRDHSLDDCPGLLESSRALIAPAARRALIAPALARRAIPQAQNLFVSIASTTHSGRAPPLL